MRTHMTAQESSLDKETARRQAAETKAKALEMELELLQNTMEEKSSHTASTISVCRAVFERACRCEGKVRISTHTPDACRDGGSER